MHDPARHVDLLCIVIRGRDVIDDVHVADGCSIQIHKRRFQGRTIWHANEFIAVQRQHEIPAMIVVRPFDEARHGRSLIENSVVVAAQRQRQSLVRQTAQDGRGLVCAAVVENVKTIEKCSIVANERLDDIALVPNRGDSSETHLFFFPDLN
jgi:hypothetical protein